jgi:5-methyltetrahydropteroyltriglutamate--homocysteine methyltransferase
VRSKLATGALRLADDALPDASHGRHGGVPSGPHALVKRIRNEYYPSEEAFALDLARVMNSEMREMVRAGATHLQIDEPYYSGFPEDLAWGIRAVNAMVEGVAAHVTLHICYGNRYGKPSFEGTYRYLFPTVLDAKVQTISLEFARRGGTTCDCSRSSTPFALGFGVIDVKTPGDRPAWWPIGSAGRST